MTRPLAPRTPSVDHARRPPFDRRPVTPPLGNPAGPSIAATVSQPIARAMKRIRRPQPVLSPVSSVRAETNIDRSATPAVEPTIADLYSIIDALVEQNQILAGLVRSNIEQSQEQLEVALSFMRGVANGMGIEIGAIEAVAGPGDDDDDEEAPVEPEAPTEPDVQVPEEIEAPSDAPEIIEG